MIKSTRYKAVTNFVSTSTQPEYTAAFHQYTEKNDIVLNVGCGTGQDAFLLSQLCTEVIGIDHNPRSIAIAERNYPSIQFHELDAFDIASIAKLEKKFTKIFIDLWTVASYGTMSGYGSLLDAISVLSAYAAAFGPEIIIVKSSDLKYFLSLCDPKRPKAPRIK